MQVARLPPPPSACVHVHSLTRHRIGTRSKNTGYATLLLIPAARIGAPQSVSSPKILEVGGCAAVTTSAESAEITEKARKPTMETEKKKKIRCEM